MARHGPQPKNPASKQGKSVAVALEVVRGGKLETPDPPSGMLKATVTGWEAFWSSDLAAAVQVQDLPVLERLFLMRDEWERCRRAVREAPLVTGSQGQSVENPMAKRMDRMNTEIRQLEDRFGLNPSGRARLNVSFGDAVRTSHDLLAGYSDDDIQVVNAGS